MKKKKIKVVAMFLLMLGMIIVSEQTAQAKDIPIDKEHFWRFGRKYSDNICKICSLLLCRIL